jgi:hypothetical protein
VKDPGPTEKTSGGDLLLSQRREALLANTESGDRVTVNQLLVRTEGRSLYLVIMFLCLPFVLPIAPPGTSGVLGSIVMVLAIRLSMSLPPRVPRVLGDKPLPAHLQRRILSSGVKLLRYLEKWVRPRHTEWLAWPMARSANALLIAFMALLLALPLPVPLTNMLPSYAIILLAASMMEEDGHMIWWGYLMSLVVVMLFGGLAAIVLFSPKYYERLVHWL